jgi:D-alanyl-D-alanine carboxypeptidase
VTRSLLVLAATAASLACGDPVGGPGPTEPLPTRLQRILTDSAAANGVIGAQAAVRIPGLPVWIGVTGVNRPGDAMRPELMIGTGSISKMITAVAALRLVDRGLIRLDDPIGRWFPAVPNVDPTITVERLLQNTSGLADYSAGPNFGAVILADPARTWLPTELLPFIGPPLFVPGTGWDASNTNRLLLGMIVEQETGQSLGAFLAAELFGGFSSTWLAGDGIAPGPLADQWFVDGAGNRTNYTTTFFGPALFSARREVHTSAGDLAAFAERLFAGELLSPATKAAMLTIVPDDGSIAGQTGGGLGIRRYDFLGRTLYGHSGATSNSTALVLFDPATGIVAAVSVNQNGPSHRQSHFRLTPALLQAAIAATIP